MGYSSKIRVSVAALLLIAAPAFAQKKNFTIAEATNGMGTTLAPKGIKNASWQPGTANLWQASKEGGADVWKVTNYDKPKGSGSSTVATGDYPVKVTGMPALKWLEKDKAYFTSGSDIVTGTFIDNKWVWTQAAELPENAENVTVDKSRSIAYTVDNNLYLQDKTTRSKVAVTNEMDKNIISGKAVHRDEFGID